MVWQSKSSDLPWGRFFQILNVFQKVRTLFVIVCFHSVGRIYISQLAQAEGFKMNIIFGNRGTCPFLSARHFLWMFRQTVAYLNLYPFPKNITTDVIFLTIFFKDRIFWKNLLENKELYFDNGVTNTQARVKLGRTVIIQWACFHIFYEIW